MNRKAFLKKLKARPARVRAWPAPQRPESIQLNYLQQLKRLLALIRAQVDTRVRPLLPELAAQAAARRGDVHEDVIDPGERLNKLFDRISESFYKAWSPEKQAKIPRAIAASTADYHKSQFARQLAASLGIDPLLPEREFGMVQRIKDFTASNVALITKLSDQTLNEIHTSILRGISEGTRHEDIAAELDDQFQLGEDRAALIARDQVGKFYGALDAARQQDLGAESFIWRTVNDERVRNAHEDFNGNEYPWDDPPGDGSPQEGTIPGSAVNCRCYAEPVFPDLEGGPAQEEDAPPEDAPAEP